MRGRSRPAWALLGLPLLFGHGWPDPARWTAELPGTEWVEASPRIELLYARPWPIPDLHQGSLRGRVLGEGVARVQWSADWLNAGKVRSWRASLALGAGTGLGWIRARLVHEEVQVEGAAASRVDGLGLVAALPLGPALVAARREGIAFDGGTALRARGDLLLRWVEERWSAAVLRSGSRWGELPTWELGISVGSSTGSALAFRWSEPGAQLALRRRGARMVQRLGLTLDGPRAGAIALSLGWEP